MLWIIILANLYANWIAPKNITALTTLRTEGCSVRPYDSNNLGLHVGDESASVHYNREQLSKTLQLPRDPEWLEQIHSTRCVVVENDSLRQADAAITRSKCHVLAIMTADCLPILLCNQQGNEIAAIHAGWKGLVNGIVEETLTKMLSARTDLIAWIGPAICKSCFEVGDEVREMYQANYSFAGDYFKKHQQKWLADLPRLAEKILNKEDVNRVYQANACTFERKNELYSYRRESQTGRMASLIWFNELTQD